MKVPYKILVLVLFTISYTSTCCAQEYALKIQKVKRGKIKKTKLYKEGTTLIIKSKRGIHKGIFAVKDSVSILLNNGEVINLNDIKKIRTPKPAKTFVGILVFTVGGIITTAGMIETIGSSATAFATREFNNSGEGTTLIGLGIVSAGTYIMATTYGYPVNKNWTLSIVENE